MESKETQFKIGNSGGPGRPKGSRNKITKAYLKRLTEDFMEHGVEVLERLREKQPDAYMRLVAQLVPKDIDVKHTGDITVQVVNYSEED